MSYKQQVIDLWQVCFKDTDAFVQLYFSTKYSDENTVVHVEDGKVLSALQLLPYSMTCWNRELHISYISGASTWPESRGLGLMKNLLIKSFGIMRSRNIQFSTLIPAESWLFEYYRKVGYGTVFYTSLQTYKEIKMGQRPTRKSYSEEELYAYFMMSMQKRPCCIQHSFADFQVILADLHLAGGKVLALPTIDGYIGGLAFIVPESEKVWIKEWMYDNEKMRTALLAEIKATYPQCEIVSLVPASARDGKPYGMMRIIDAPMILHYYAAAYPEIDVTFSLRDEQIPSNTATYVLHKGFCEKKLFQPDCETPVFSPADLIEKLFSDDSVFLPCMTLMLN